MNEIIKKIISNRWFLSFITVLITGVIFKFMSKAIKSEHITYRCSQKIFHLFL